MAYRKILLKGNGFHEEAFAAAAFSPGHLVELASTGKVQKHSTAGGFAERLFAKEAPLQGRGIDTAYAQDELAFLYVGQPGDEINAFIATNQTIAVGERLISAGDGSLRSAVDSVSGVTIKEVVAVALEAITTTSTSTRTRVRLV